MNSSQTYKWFRDWMRIVFWPWLVYRERNELRDALERVADANPWTHAQSIAETELARYREKRRP